MTATLAGLLCLYLLVYFTVQIISATLKKLWKVLR